MEALKKVHREDMQQLQTSLQIAQESLERYTRSRIQELDKQEHQERELALAAVEPTLATSHMHADHCEDSPHIGGGRQVDGHESGARCEVCSHIPATASHGSDDRPEESNAGDTAGSRGELLRALDEEMDRLSCERRKFGAAKTEQVQEDGSCTGGVGGKQSVTQSEIEAGDQRFLEADFGAFSQLDTTIPMQTPTTATPHPQNDQGRRAVLSHRAATVVKYLDTGSDGEERCHEHEMATDAPLRGQGNVPAGGGCKEEAKGNWSQDVATEPWEKKATGLLDFVAATLAFNGLSPMEVSLALFIHSPICPSYLPSCTAPPVCPLCQSVIRNNRRPQQAMSLCYS